ncbi:hypothetical protein Sste5346_008668 [Sporothrix stenoceras]|uniref:Uncharacterized protein n=1 Tax=Sporothrix stenoceras TaxID=5173 RepID=A0ABR3YN70_9PEZI
MPNYTRHDTATSNVLAWTAHAANAVEEDAAADADEPPDQRQQSATTLHTFEKTTVYRPRERTESLLTRALQSQSEDEAAEHIPASGLYPRRRRSITSNTSMASTAGFTSDTGITTPPRTNSPSPRMVSVGFAPVNGEVRDAKAAAAPSMDTTPKPAANAASKDATKPETTAAAAPPRKRCISFACGAPKPSEVAKAKPASPPAPATKTPGPDDTPKAAYAQLAQPVQVTEPPKPVEQQVKRSCIRFACPAKPSTDTHKPQLSTLKLDAPENRVKAAARRPSPAPAPKSPTAIRRMLPRRDSANRSPRSVTRSSASRQASHSPIATRSKKYYNAEPSALNEESSRFHEFASDAVVEDDWIRREKATVQQRLTIRDTLAKELKISLLGKEAEEEAEEEDNDDENNDDDDDEDVDEDDDDDEDDDEDDEEEEDDDNDDENDTVEGENEYLPGERFAGYSSGVSDGYNTDNETGFASSDDEDDGLVLWAVNQPGRQRREHNFDNDHSTLHQGGSPIFRRLSVDEHSDSSGFIAGHAMRQERPKNRELVNTIRRTGTPELPDSTDFVCGTFDEDRPLEEAYQSHIAARKRGKTHVIPQDIDPSFPTSDPEDNSDDEPVNYKQRAQQHKQAHGSADERFWEIEDIQHDQIDNRTDARQKKRAVSPRRCRSPPPPKIRGRSPAPRRLFDRHSPTRRLKSPAPKAKAMPVPVAMPMPVPTIVASSHTRIVSPPASPVDALDNRGRPMFQTLAFKPGLTHTKSLPRPSAIFRHQKQELQLPAIQVQPQQQQQPAAKPNRRPKANSLAGAKQPKLRHVRGAIDIVKGLEQKRQRRRDKFQQKHCDRARKGQVPERRTQRGEGAERMREVGLLMAGKIPQGNYVLSV